MALLQCPRELSADQHDAPMEIPERQNYGITFSHTGFIEHYLRKEWGLLIHFQARHSGHEFVAWFQAQGDTGDTIPSVAIPLGHDRWKAIDSRDVAERGNQHIMFVDSVQLMESPQRFIPSLVWTDTPDLIYRFLPHSRYFSSKVGFVFRGQNRASEDWEFYFGTGITSISPDEGAGEIIQSRPQVLDSITAFKPDSGRDGISLEDMNRWIRGISVYIYPYSVRLSVHECANSDFDVVDVVLGPLEFIG